VKARVSKETYSNYLMRESWLLEANAESEGSFNQIGHLNESAIWCRQAGFQAVGK
jgi:hypothetical protein